MASSQRGSKSESPPLYALIKAATRTLTVPAKTGTLVTVPDLRRIASSLDLPITLRNDRSWVLEELFKTAVDYEKLPELVDSLKSLIRSRAERLEELASLYPASRRLVEDYVEAARRAEALLDDLKDVYFKVAKEGLARGSKG